MKFEHTPPPFDYSCRCEVEDLPAPLSILQLRHLIRNDEARIEHLTAWANHIGEGDFRPTDLAEWIEAAHLKLVHHRARLAGLLLLRDCASANNFPPAAPSLAGNVVTSATAQPAGSTLT